MTGDQLLSKHYTRYLSQKPSPRPMGLFNLDEFFRWFDDLVEEIPQGTRRHVVAHPGYEIYYSELPEETTAREEAEVREVQKRRFDGFNREERLALMDALATQYRQAMEVAQRSKLMGMAHLEHRSEILDALMKELNEVGFWPKEEA